MKIVLRGKDGTLAEFWRRMPGLFVWCCVEEVCMENSIERKSWLKPEGLDEKVRSGRGKTSRLFFLCVMCGEYASLDGACCREHENLQSFVGDENSG